MTLSPDIVSELTLLSQFNLASTHEGIKVHNNASSQMVSAAARLFDKGLISQIDGGYLTELGQEAAEHFDSLKHILTTPVTVDTAS